jgi:hypothetical protein
MGFNVSKWRYQVMRHAFFDFQTRLSGWDSPKTLLNLTTILPIV